MHSLNTFGVRTSHRQTRTHKTHHDPDLGETTTFPFIVYFVPPRGPHPNGILSRDSQMGVSKLLKLGFQRLWGPITSCANFWLRWGLKQSYSPCRELSKVISHTTCTQGNRVDSRLLVVGSQIANLIFDSPFDHNLCFRCPNGPHKPILHIYIPKKFQSCK